MSWIILICAVTVMTGSVFCNHVNCLTTTNYSTASYSVFTLFCLGELKCGPSFMNYYCYPFSYASLKYKRIGGKRQRWKSGISCHPIGQKIFLELNCCQKIFKWMELNVSLMIRIESKDYSIVFFYPKVNKKWRLRQGSSLTSKEIWLTN